MSPRERLEAALLAYGGPRELTNGINEEPDPDDRPASGRSYPLGPEHARQFILGGRAIFTLAGEPRGEGTARYTFRVSQAEPATEGPYAGRPAAFFVSLLTGPDNTSEYTYVGLLDPHTGNVRLTAKSKYREDSTPVLAFRWFMRRVWAGRSVLPGTLYHCGRCARCGRLLTVPSSIESGYGPECLARLSAGA